YNEKGEKINKRYTGFLARVVQHELDHLDGKLIVDRGTTIYFPKEKSLFFDKIFKDE
ncbi:MAG: peptide deformylase, partial [Deltaproteobacteria bacterium]|nr:peptide deformylase [Deltaproteobacteria bacterium]